MEGPSKKIILTDEDPYDENPEAILSDVEQGVSQKAKLRKILDRKEAISAALKSAEPGDTIIITGKGAEEVMAVGLHEFIPFSDRKIVRAELERLFG